MNLELLESFGQNYPEEFDGALDCISLAVTCAFNKHGTLLAVGCNDGRIVLWDFLTRGIAKIICAHIHPVCSLSWSRSGHKLLSASTDNTVSIWDVLSAECEYRYRFQSPILKVQFHPRNEKMILVCPMKHAAILVHVDETHSIVPLDDESDLNIVASFDRKGNYIYTGNAKGKILALSVPDLKLKASFRVTTGTSNTTSIKSIEFARRSDWRLLFFKSHINKNCSCCEISGGSGMLDANLKGNIIKIRFHDACEINAADRIIRVYATNEVLACGKDGEPEPMQKLQDLVNKTMWKKCCFSGDGEYICAGSARQHSLYIWEKSIGNLVKILHGTKGELLLDVVWHPVRPIIASISSGVVSIWAQPQVENWSAFAPDFKELDENVEYEERESEFDVEDEDKSPQLHAEKQDEDEIVDVVTVEPIAAFCSSDEESSDTAALLYLPISPEIDDPEEGWGPGAEIGPDEQPTKRQTNDQNSSKKKRTKVIDMILENAPKDETHPLLNSKSRDKVSQQTKKTGKSKQHRVNSHSEKNSHRSKHGSKNKEKMSIDYYGWKDSED